MKKTPEDIEELGRKIALVRQKKAASEQKKDENDLSRASRIGFRIGAELLSAVVVGAAIGYVADDFFGTRPWLMAVFLFLGGAAGVLNVYRLARQEDKQN